MALIKCPECGKDVSDQAVSCPHCGRPLLDAAAAAAQVAPPPAAPKKKMGCLTVIGILFAIGFGISLLSNNDSNTTGSANNKAASTQPDCRTDWTKCPDNEALVNDYNGWVEVQVACKRSATKQARYGTPEWPWLSFSTFRKGSDYATTGTAIAIEPDAQFSNGFGAMVHSKVICQYDLRKKQVIDISILPQ
jgi:hypothetical protein